MSTTPDSTVANPDQRIADLERQLAEREAEFAECKAERDAARDQQVATAEVLQVINSSPSDLVPVFDAILEKATRVCEAVFGTLSIWDGERFHWVAFRGLPTELVKALQQPLPPVGDRRPVADRIVRGEMVISAPDLREAEYRGVPVAQAFLRHGARSCVTVALRKEERLLGLITIYREEVRPFSDKQIALLQNFAAQAVIAMENARLLTETRETLEQQTATAEVLQIINSSPADLAPVFDVILEKAHRLCGATHGGLNIYDGERFRNVAAHAVPPRFAELMRQPFHPRPIQQRLLRGERYVHVPDMMTGARDDPDDPIGRASDEAGIRTLLVVPLRKENALLGYITAHREEVRPFTDKQIALLENFAAQAVIAMENARLLTETREALAQQTATAEVLQVINSSPGDLTPVFDAILEKAHRLCGGVFGRLLIREGDEFHLVAARGEAQWIEAERQLSPRRPQEGGPLARLVSGARIVHIPDVRVTDSYANASPRLRLPMDSGGVRTALFVPLRKDGALLGAITASRPEVRPFSEKQIALLQNFAAQAVIAMENARLLAELRQRTEEVAELNRGLEARVAEQVEELGRVGRLKRFLAPQLAEMIVSQGDEKILESHRREIVVVFCDLRGYTAFTETAEPEEVLNFLREYHGALGPLVSQFEGTLDQFSGDGIMVFFNDPVPIPDPAVRAVKMAMAMREAASKLTATWRRRGRELGFGAGIAQGYATLGQIGFAERSGYTAIGTVCNLAARLCAEAEDGQILVDQRVAVAVEEMMALEEVGTLNLKGLTQPVVAFNVPPAATQRALRVIEGGGPQSV
jgi:GAF domain-containing protein